MALDFTGEQNDTLNAVVLRAKDGDGNTVAVHVSHEAMQDHGLEECQRIASEKFAAGETKVHVRTG